MLVKLSFSIQSLVQDSTDISMENEMNIQPWVTVYLALLARTQQYVVITPRPVQYMQALVSLRTVAPIPGGRTGFVLIPHSSRSGTTLLLLLSRVRLCLQAHRVPGWDPDWVGMRGMQIRVRGGRECRKLNEEIEESGAWLPQPLAHLDRSSISEGRGASAPSSSTPTAQVWTNQSRRTHQQQHSELSPQQRWICGSCGTYSYFNILWASLLMHTQLWEVTPEGNSSAI